MALESDVKEAVDRAKKAGGFVREVNKEASYYKKLKRRDNYLKKT